MNIWWLLITLVIVGCARQSPESASDAFGEMRAGKSAEGGGRGYGMAGAPMPMPASEAMEESLVGDIAPRRSSPVLSTPAPEPDARLVHYEGWARLLVSDPPATLDAAVAIAEASGGRTERMSGTVVTLRVPRETFAAVWEQIRALGDILDESVRADDVTDAFLDTDLRVRVLEGTLARLVQLLAKAQEEEEKLRLLQEITRVTEQLDQLRSQLRTISDLAAMARITIEAVPREAFSGSGNQPELDGFAWVRGLSPFRRDVWSDDHRVSLDTPEGLVELDKKGPYIAEAADGTVLWTMRVENDPVGDAGFWTTSVSERIAREFDAPAVRPLGRWSCLTLAEPGADAPYSWTVCVADQGRWLEVAQAFFPTPEAAARWSKAVDAALAAGGAS